MYKENQRLKVFRAVLIGMLVGLVLCSIMIVVLSLVLVKTGQMPTNAVFVALQAISAVSAFLGSYISVRICKSRGLMVGLLTALAMFAVIFMVGLSMSVEPVSMLSLTKLIAMLCAGAMGGVVSVNKKQRVKKY